MASRHGALIIFGSGPGLGRNIAALFAERGFEKVILLSRNEERLKDDASFVRSRRAGIHVEYVRIDLADIENVRSALKQVEEKLADTPLEAIFYNAARLGQSKFFEFSPEQLESDLRISIVNLYTVAQWAVPQMLKVAEKGESSPLLVVTSGLLHKDPSPAVFSLGAGKGGQYNLVQSLHKELEPKGIHCALIVVGGTVADESQVTNARNVAEEAWKLYEQPKGQGNLEVVMMDPDFESHKKNRERNDRN